MERDTIISVDALYESMEKCSNGVRWKGTVAYYRHHWPDELAKLSAQLHNGTYKARKGKYFVVTEPKRREIMSVHFRDRIYQRSLNDVAIYQQTSKSFISDNFACQKGKGTLPARDRLKEFLRRYYRKNGTEGYVLKMDIKGYYPNMRHDYAESMLRGYLDNVTYEMAVGVLSNLPGDVGYNPGSQIVQIVGITALDKVDHFIKERLRVKYYIRYMDDLILIHEDKKYLIECWHQIEHMLAGIGMELHPKKTCIKQVSEKILYLGFVYRLTSTGKVVVLEDPAKIKHERKKLKRMAALVKAGKMTKYQVDRHFKQYKACIRYGNSTKLIFRLNSWYKTLWEDQNGNYQEEKN